MLTQAVVRYAIDRMRLDPPPLDQPHSPLELRAMAGRTVTPEGIGGLEALRVFGDVLAPSCISIDHPKFLSFVPAAPTESSMLFDLVVGATSVYAGSWLEGAGAIFAENEALRWIADLVGLPESAGGVFVSGGTAGNLSALIDRLFAIVATAGTTNAGVIDELDGAADVAQELGTWLHVDGAYGGAALAAPSVRALFTGVERADSFIVDPHKWLFAPFDSCALLYREPEIGRAAHTQHAEYLEVLHTDDPTVEPWNASDYAHHLSRRARGLPLWFSLATHGTGAYVDAVETTLTVAREAARLIDDTEHTELVMEPELSVVLFRRVGWSRAEYQAWSDRELEAGRAFVVPTTWQGETVLRFCIVNPRTSIGDIGDILATLAEPAPETVGALR